MALKKNRPVLQLMSSAAREQVSMVVTDITGARRSLLQSKEVMRDGSDDFEHFYKDGKSNLDESRRFKYD